MLSNKSNHGVIKHFTYRNKNYIGIRINNSLGKIICPISSLKFVKISNDKYGFRCCKIYYIGKGEKHRIVYCDIFDNKEYDTMFVNVLSVYDFINVVSAEELESYNYVLTDNLIKEKLDNLNIQDVLKL